MKNTKDKVTLYIGTHNKTGLKYFGKTTKYFTEEDLQKYYHGSGIDWKEHLREFGNDVTMKIYGIYNISDVREKATKFSKDNNIANSPLWANRIKENGFNGGGNGWKLSEERKKEIGNFHRNKKVSNESKARMSESAMGRVVSLETKEKIRLGNLGKNTGPISEETKEKISNSLKGKKASDETKKKMSTKRKGVKQPRGLCPHCGFEGGLWSMKGHHFNKCKNK